MMRLGDGAECTPGFYVIPLLDVNCVLAWYVLALFIFFSLCISLYFMCFLFKFACLVSFTWQQDKFVLGDNKVKVEGYIIGL